MMNIQNGRVVCHSGISEPFLHGNPSTFVPEQHSSSAPSTQDLKKARRLATKKRFSLSCTECKRVKRKCGDKRPCDRCISLRLDQSCTEVFTEYSCAIIDRPINFCTTSMHFQRSIMPPQDTLKHQWSSSIIRQVWEIGYKYSAFVEVFNAVPATLSASIATLIDALAQRSKVIMNQTRYTY